MPKRPTNRPRSSTRRGRDAAPRGETPKTGERLQKILAAAGVASRRDCEEMIVEGRVMVDGRVVTKLGARADLATQEIVVDGQKLKRPKHVYYAVYKPEGVVSTSHDPSGRTRLVDLAPDQKRLFCVGRLDRSSEGLALLTNDGELAHRIMHPSFGVAKTYVVEVAGGISQRDLDNLQEGVFLAEGRARASRARIKSKRSKSTVLEIELREGKNREIRRIMAKLGHKVLKLRRIAIGPLRLGDMAEGSYRELTREEIAALRKGSSAAPATKSRSPKSGKPSRGAAPGGQPAAKAGPPAMQHLADDDDYDFDDDFVDLSHLDDDDFEQGDLETGGDELIEVRDSTPAPRGRGGAVIGGEAPSRDKRSAGKAGSRKAPPRKASSRKAAPRKASAGKSAPRGGSGGKPSRGKPSGGKSSGGKPSGGKAARPAPRGASAKGKPAGGKAGRKQVRTGKGNRKGTR